MRVHRRHNVRRGEPAELAEAHRLGVLNGTQSIRIALRAMGNHWRVLIRKWSTFIHSIFIEHLSCARHRPRTEVNMTPQGHYPLGDDILEQETGNLQGK